MKSLEQLERLHALHNAGALTDEEYAREKAKLLSGSVADQALQGDDDTVPERRSGRF